MKPSIFKKLILLSLLAFGHASYAESLKTIRIGSPDLTAGQKHAGGGVVDVLYNKKWLPEDDKAETCATVSRKACPASSSSAGA